MNLIDLVVRKDKVVELGHNLPIKFIDWQGVSWRGLGICAADSPQLVITKINKFTALMARPPYIGWYASCKTGPASLVVTLENQERISRIQISLGETPTPISIPWTVDGRLIDDYTKLKLHFIIPKDAQADLLVHSRLDRKQLTNLAHGCGVELGPGPSPQIFASDEIEVSYVEETPAERWKELYDHTGRRKAAQADFSKYIIGTAWDIPNPDGALDFIFSSHVFEHLANPLGHLLRWQKKLKPGGVVLAVVPDLSSTKDYRMLPSTLDEIRVEHNKGIHSPDCNHYERWAALRGPMYDVEELMRTNTSIHVHFYNPANMADLLRECIIKHGYSTYSIIQSQNHKDFYFCLWK